MKWYDPEGDRKCHWRQGRGWVCTREWNHDAPCALEPTRWTRIKYWLNGIKLG